MIYFFSGAEQVIRTLTRECEDFDVAILDVARPVAFTTVDDAVSAAQAWMSGGRRS